jgi:xanthine dehydrogenase accessory factor
MLDLSTYLVLIKGAGDLATGVALRLHRAGFPLVMTEVAAPLAVRRTVAFAQAVYDGRWTVEGVTAQRAAAEEAPALLAAGKIPVVVDPAAACRQVLQPAVIVDAIMAKQNTGTQRDDAPQVVALGPGFVAGGDCHAVIETQRGHYLGRVLWQGAAIPNTGTPGELPGVGGKASRVLRAPVAGHVQPHKAIGDSVAEGALIATVGAAEIRAPFPGILRGLIHPAVHVPAGLKIGDLDPRADRAYCFTVSDKALAIGGGVIEAILHWMTGER